MALAMMHSLLGRGQSVKPERGATGDGMPTVHCALVQVLDTDDAS